MRHTDDDFRFGKRAAPVDFSNEIFDHFFGDIKIGVIKAVRALTGLGLKEAKAMVEGVPATVKEAAAKGDAEDAVKQLTEAGATAELK